MFLLDTLQFQSVPSLAMAIEAESRSWPAERSSLSFKQGLIRGIETNRAFSNIMDIDPQDILTTSCFEAFAIWDSAVPPFDERVLSPSLAVENRHFLSWNVSYLFSRKNYEEKLATERIPRIESLCSNLCINSWSFRNVFLFPFGWLVVHS